METKAVLLLMRKNRWWIFSLTITAFFLGFFIYKIIFSTFTAETILLVNIEKSEQQGSSESERYAFSILNSVNFERIYCLVYSDEMVQYLDKEFDLKSNYGINNFPVEYRSSKLIQSFSSHVKLQKESESVINLEVKDYNAEFAAILANAIAGKLIEMNSLFAQKVIEQKAGMCTLLVDEITKRSKQNIESLRKSFTDVVNINFQNKQPDNLKNIFEIQSRLDLTLNNFNNSISELNKTNEIYTWSLKAFENYKTTSIFVLNKAYPDYEGKVLRYLKAVLMGVGTSILVFCICCVLVYSFRVNKEFLKILFGKQEK